MGLVRSLLASDGRRAFEINLFEILINFYLFLISEALARLCTPVHQRTAPVIHKPSDIVMIMTFGNSINNVADLSPHRLNGEIQMSCKRLTACVFVCVRVCLIVYRRSVEFSSQTGIKSTTFRIGAKMLSDDYFIERSLISGQLALIQRSFSTEWHHFGCDRIRNDIFSPKRSEKERKKKMNRRKNERAA